MEVGYDTCLPDMRGNALAVDYSECPSAVFLPHLLRDLCTFSVVYFRIFRTEGSYFKLGSVQESLYVRDNSATAPFPQQ